MKQLPLIGSLDLLYLVNLPVNCRRNTGIKKVFFLLPFGSSNLDRDAVWILSSFAGNL